MATKTKTAAQAREVKYSAEMGEYNDMPTWSVGEEGSRAQSRLSHTLAKWAKLFTIDEDGDSNLTNLFLALYENAESHEGAASILASAKRFVAQLAYQLEEVDEDEQEKVCEDEDMGTMTEEEPARLPTKDELDKVRKMLSTQTRIWRTCQSDMEREALVMDAWAILVRDASITWEEYRPALGKYATAVAYLNDAR